MSKRSTNIELDPIGITKPFLRWPGGKRWLVPIVKVELCGMTVGNYFEPFLGGGAFFFNIGTSTSILSDINPELINAYVHVKDNPHLILRKLKVLPVSSEQYVRMRNYMPKDSISRAVRFLYLNRTSFNGLYRLNKNGDFNVPYGGGSRTPEVLWRDGLIINASKALQRASLLCSDFEEVIELAQDGDLIYCDPIYTVKHNNNGFKRYNEKVFSWQDQERLSRCCQKAIQRGVTVIVSNAHHYDIRQLYPEFRARVVNRLSMLSAKPEFRCTSAEYLFIGGPKRRIMSRVR